MPPTYAQGTDGRVREGALNTIVAFIEEWKVTKSLTAYGPDTFENAADTNGVVWKRKGMKSMAEATATMTGWFDIDTNSETVLFLGKSVVLDLLLFKASPFGLGNLAGTISKIEYGNKATATQPATFSAEVALDGLVPAAAVAT